MKGPKATSIAHKKIDSAMVKKRKADASAKKEKASKKNSGAPKRPSSAFFVFILMNLENRLLKSTMRPSKKRALSAEDAGKGRSLLQTDEY
ncbi:hypothetical protein LOK49_LG07G02501 [Camellia lanceoleosa]|uniref:Uncharacterized protein n=1 Tax=Camellia lanceoleosa TaxID=1840588 RepID=A0ACC0GZW4_9ERIC|nr:hypothetical protein LOK49_LG07G02501 [Camellia lanceoleosa]